MSDPKYRLRAFGGLAITSSGGAAPAIASHRKKLALLAAVACAGDRGVSRDRLLAWLWPESDTDRARNSLNQFVHSIRRELGDDAVLAANGDLRLNPAVVGSDLADFRAAVANDSPEAAAGVYTGPFLDAVFLRDVPEFERWVDDTRISFASEYMRALDAALDRATAQARPDDAVHWARLLAQHDPLSPRHALRLMKALDQVGDVPAAIRHAELYSRRIRAELETSPDPAIDREVARLRATRRESDAPPQTSASVGATRTVARPKWRALLGGSVLVTSALAGASALFARNRDVRIEFGAVRPLTNEPGLELQPALSPDGELFAYAAGQVGSLRLYVRPTHGGPPIALAEQLAGQQLSPRWSPDGGRILFTSIPPGGEIDASSIYSVSNPGDTPRLLVHRAAYGCWSPDGHDVAFVRGDSLFTRAADGGDERKVVGGLATEMHSLAWSPDGKFITFISGNARFWTGGALLGNLAPSVVMVVRAAGGKPIALTDGRFMHMSPAWLPDSRHLLVMSTEGGGRDLYELDVGVSGRPSGHPVRLTTGLSIGTFSVSSNGSLLAYSDFPNTSNIRAVPIRPGTIANEKDARPVTTGTQHVEVVAVSHDGRWLAFDSDRGGAQALYRMPVGGGAPTPITSDPSYAFFPSFSPDGREIAFHSWRNGSRDLYVVGVAGGEDHLVAGGPAQECCADWSADGNSIVFHSDRTGRNELWLVTRTSETEWGQPHRLTHDGGGQPRWSPDGRVIAYLSPRGIALVSPVNGQSRDLVTRQNLNASTGLPVFLAWSPDSRTLYFKSFLADGRASIWEIAADGGTARLVARFGTPDFASARIEFATDGRLLYFTADDRQSDIRLMSIRMR